MEPAAKIKTQSHSLELEQIAFQNAAMTPKVPAVTGQLTLSHEKTPDIDIQLGIGEYFGLVIIKHKGKKVGIPLSNVKSFTFK